MQQMSVHEQFFVAGARAVVAARTGERGVTVCGWLIDLVDGPTTDEPTVTLTGWADETIAWLRLPRSVAGVGRAGRGAFLTGRFSRDLNAALRDLA